MPTINETTSATRTKTKKQAGRPTGIRSRPSQCRPTTGYFPEINRDLLARKVGCSASFISYIFKGRSEPKLELGMKIARAMDITFEQLNDTLMRARREYRKAKGDGVPNGKIVTGAKKKKVAA